MQRQNKMDDETKMGIFLLIFMTIIIIIFFNYAINADQKEDERRLNYCKNLGYSNYKGQYYIPEFGLYNQTIIKCYNVEKIYNNNEFKINYNYSDYIIYAEAK